MARKRRPNLLTQAFRTSERREVDAALLERVRDVYERGRYLDALTEAERAGPLQSWSGAVAAEIGSRLAMNLGGERLGRLLVVRGHRAHPAADTLARQYAFSLVMFRGPLAGWAYALRFVQQHSVSEEVRAELLALRARIAAEYRDFDTAERLIRDALALRPSSPWLKVEQSYVLLCQERREHALTPLDEALRLSPWFRPAVQFRARLLHVLGRAEEAIALLTQSLEHLQCGGVVLQLIHLKRELDDDVGMLALLDSAEALHPFWDGVQREWLAARRTDAYCLRREFSRAAAQADLIGDGYYYPELAKRLRVATGTEKRVRLPVPFIPQGHLTCGPATLAAIAQFLGKPATQEAIVDAISYGGTSDHIERDWCESNGFAAREFKVTWDAVRLLTDAGVPFALATTEVGSGHLQALIGYDELRQTLFIQDPGEPH